MSAPSPLPVSSSDAAGDAPHEEAGGRAGEGAAAGRVGRIILAATPIGDPSDAPAHLTTLLGAADVVAAEDTRRLRRLCAALGVEPSGRVISYHEHNEQGRSDDLVAQAAAGATVLLVTDAGMPTVSDPGYRVVVAAIAAGVRVSAVPGPSAVLTALAVSGLATDRFCFEGFLPRKVGERARALTDLAGERRTMVFFEAPHRLADSLLAMAEAFGPDRPAAVCRELTKTYEEVRRGPLAQLSTWAAALTKIGEVTLVVGGATDAVLDTPAAARAVLALVAGGQRLKDAVAEIASVHGLGRRALYEAALAARAGDPPPGV